MDISAFLDQCDRYCATTSLSEARLSTILFGSGMTISRLRKGKGVTVRVLARAVDRLSARIASDKAKAAADQREAVPA